MGTTTYKLLQKLVAGASTRADLISYWNENAEILDALLRPLYAAGGNLGIGASPKNLLQIHNYGALDGNSLVFFISNNAYYDVVDIRDERLKSGYASRMVMSNDAGNIRFDLAQQSLAADTEIAWVAACEIQNDLTVYCYANCSALTFTDRTPHFQGDALAAIRKIKATEKGEIDHATLPDFAVNPYHDEKGEWWPGRSLGDMVSVLTVAIQQLAASYDAAIAERDSKIDELSKRIDALAAKLPA